METVFSASIVGGLGDIIFGLEGFRVLKNTISNNAKVKCILCTHAESGLELVRANPYVDNIVVIEFQNDLSHMAKLTNIISKDKNYLGEARNFANERCDIYIPDKYLAWAKKEIKNPYTFVIHPCGSKFSSLFLTSKGDPSKEVYIWNTVIDVLYNITIKYCDQPEILFIGTKEEHNYIDDLINETKISKNIFQNLAGKNNIFESVALIKNAKIIFGVDSFAKSVSLAENIPTVVFVNSNKDKFRDSVFIDPYKNNSNALILSSIDKMNTQDITGLLSQFIEQHLSGDNTNE